MQSQLCFSVNKGSFLASVRSTMVCRVCGGHRFFLLYQGLLALQEARHQGQCHPRRGRPDVGRGVCAAPKDRCPYIGSCAPSGGEMHIHPCCFRIPAAWTARRDVCSYLKESPCFGELWDGGQSVPRAGQSHVDQVWRRLAVGPQVRNPGRRATPGWAAHRGLERKGPETAHSRVLGQPF